MALIIPTYAKGCNGTLTCIGLDDTFEHRIKTGAFRLRFRNPLEDVSGYGDACNSVYRDTILSGFISVEGWVITNSTDSPGLTNLGGDGCALTATIDTGRTYSGTVLQEQFIIDHRYNRRVPIRFDGNFTAAITETWA